MVNQKMNWDVDRDVYLAVSRAVDWSVHEAVNGAAENALSGAAHWAVADAVYLTVNEDPPHPALQDFLSKLGENL